MVPPSMAMTTSTVRQEEAARACKKRSGGRQNQFGEAGVRRIESRRALTALAVTAEIT